MQLDEEVQSPIKKEPVVTKVDVPKKQELKRETFAGEEKKSSAVNLNRAELEIESDNITMAKQLLDELREELHREMNNMHIEIIRQFQIQLVSSCINRVE
jgi:predicted secreted protein